MKGGEMDPISIAFFDAKPYDINFFNQANSIYSYRITYFPNHLVPETVPLAKGFEVVCIFVNDHLSKEVIDQLRASGTRLIALRCAGYNNVDLKAAYGQIHVVRVPAYSPHAVAEYAIAMILSLNRKTHRAYYRTRDGNFAIGGLLGFDMFGKTAGVIGTGKIGKVVAGILKGFGMRVLLYDQYPDQEFGEKTGLSYVDLNQLFQESDIITLHCPLTPLTQYLIAAGSLERMKEGVMIINTGRGKLINTRDLIEALKSQKVGAAGLDVYEEEEDYFFEDFSSHGIEDDVLARLLTFPNVLVTSHQAFFTAEALKAIVETTMRNISDFFRSKPLINEICYRCGSEECLKKSAGKCF
jgi:D-lactate dehydrogenase